MLDWMHQCSKGLLMSLVNAKSLETWARTLWIFSIFFLTPLSIISASSCIPPEILIRLFVIIFIGYYMNAVGPLESSWWKDKGSYKRTQAYVNHQAWHDKWVWSSCSTNQHKFPKTSSWHDNSKDIILLTLLTPVTVHITSNSFSSSLRYEIGLWTASLHSSPNVMCLQYNLLWRRAGEKSTPRELQLHSWPGITRFKANSLVCIAAKKKSGKDQTCQTENQWTSIVSNRK